MLPLLLLACRPDVDTPAGRRDHVAFLDASGAHLYVAGGEGEEGALADAWVVELATGVWTRLPDAPAPFVGAAAVSDGQEAWLFGGEGEDGATTDHLWRWSFVDGAWTELLPAGAAPPARAHGAAALRTGQMYVYGGEGGTALGDLWELDPVTVEWTELQLPGGPGAIHHHAVCADAAEDLWVSGGIDGDGVASDALWRLGGRDGAWEELPWMGDNPGARSGHSLVCTPQGPLLWGGDPVDVALWSYDPGDGAWSSLDAPASPFARAGHAAAWDGDAAALLVMGGERASGDPPWLSDVWRFEGGRWQNPLPDGSAP